MIANIERVANLFVTKTVYALFLAVAIGLVRWPYPFLPRHLTLVSSLTIGIPGFFLALAPNDKRYVPGFIHRVARFAVPAGIVAGAATMVSYAIAHWSVGVTNEQAQTAATITLMCVGLWVLNLLARPITPGRAVLFGAMVGAFLVVLAVPSFSDFFALDVPHGVALDGALVCAIAGMAVLEVGWQWVEWRRPPDERTRRLALVNPARDSPPA